jgi:hypothetical protein
MFVAKLTGYVLLFPYEVEVVSGTAARTLSALTSAATGTVSDPPVDPEPEPEPDLPVIRLRVALVGTERRTISLNATVRRV